MIIFFINRNNDVDHIAPIVYKLASDGNKNILILSMNPTHDIYRDYRLVFLKETLGVTVDYLYSFYCPTLAHKWFGSVIKSRSFQGASMRRVKSVFSRHRRSGGDRKENPSIFKGLGYLVAGLFKKYFFWKLFNNVFIKYYYDYKWVDQLLEKTKSSTLVFDFAARSKLFVVDSLVSAAKQRSIYLVFVPHGLFYFPQKHWQISNQLPVLLEHKPDAIVVSHKRWAQDLIDADIPAEKVKVLGSARFCDEWFRVLQDIRSTVDIPTKSGDSKIKVLYVERQGDRHGKYKVLVQEMLEKVSSLSFVELLIQPSARSGRVHIDTVNLPDGCVSYVDSVSLCKWADVVICLSSILFEVLIQDKLYLNAKYLHGETILSEEYGVGLTINSYEELKNALERLHLDRNYRPYSYDKVNSFMVDLVYGGEKGRDVLGMYRDLLMKKDDSVVLGI